VWNLAEKMAGSTGFEPATSGLTERGDAREASHFPRTISSLSRTYVSQS
jgi:hypothetical protein